MFDSTNAIDKVMNGFEKKRYKRKCLSVEIHSLSYFGTEKR
jgi:hypothetical protein